MCSGANFSDEIGDSENLRKAPKSACLYTLILLKGWAISSGVCPSVCMQTF